MTAIAQRLRNLRARWSEARARKRERDASAAHAQAHRDPNPPLTRATPRTTSGARTGAVAANRPPRSPSSPRESSRARSSNQQRRPRSIPLRHSAPALPRMRASSAVPTRPSLRTSCRRPAPLDRRPSRSCIAKRQQRRLRYRVPCKAVAFHRRPAHRRLGARGAAPPAHARPPPARRSSCARWLYVCKDPSVGRAEPRGLDKPALHAIYEDTRNAVRARVRLCPTACPTRPEFPMVKPNQPGIIIRVSGVRVPPPASRKARNPGDVETSSPAESSPTSWRSSTVAAS